jgi:hypothetical protein
MISQGGKCYAYVKPEVFESMDAAKYQADLLLAWLRPSAGYLENRRLMLPEALTPSAAEARRYWTHHLSELRDFGLCTATVPQTVPHRVCHPPKPLPRSR